MKALDSLSLSELSELAKRVNEFAWPVLDTFPKQRSKVDEARLAMCRRMWIDIHNAECKELNRIARLARKSS